MPSETRRTGRRPRPVSPALRGALAAFEALELLVAAPEVLQTFRRYADSGSISAAEAWLFAREPFGAGDTRNMRLDEFAHRLGKAVVDGAFTDIDIRHEIEHRAPGIFAIAERADQSIATTNAVLAVGYSVAMILMPAPRPVGGSGVNEMDDGACTDEKDDGLDAAAVQSKLFDVRMRSAMVRAQAALKTATLDSTTRGEEGDSDLEFASLVVPSAIHAFRGRTFTIGQVQPGCVDVMVVAPLSGQNEYRANSGIAPSTSHTVFERDGTPPAGECVAYAVLREVGISNPALAGVLLRDEDGEPSALLAAVDSLVRSVLDAGVPVALRSDDIVQWVVSANRCFDATTSMGVQIAPLPPFAQGDTAGAAIDAVPEQGGSRALDRTLIAGG